MLPVVYILHDLEEMFMRRKWEKKYFDETVKNHPKVKSVLSTLKGLNQLEYGIVVFEQFLFLTIAVVWGTYADPMPMCALFWGFGLHLFIHILHTVFLRLYFPGVISSLLLIPYFAFGVHDLLQQYTLAENIIMAVGGLAVIALNLTLMYWLMKKFSDLE